jgi:hypothetical protein
MNIEQWQESGGGGDGGCGSNCSTYKLKQEVLI